GCVRTTYRPGPDVASPCASQANGANTAPPRGNPPENPCASMPKAAGSRMAPAAQRAGYFLFLRWMRVFFSSLRCFFLAMRLRRFLMTEPIRPPPFSVHNGRRARHHAHRIGEAGRTPGVET